MLDPVFVLTRYTESILTDDKRSNMGERNLTSDEQCEKKKKKLRHEIGKKNTK